MTCSEIISVVRAFEAKQPIQSRFKQFPNEWADDPEPNWNFKEKDYRVKPEPLEVKPREWAVLLSEVGNIKAGVKSPEGAPFDNSNFVLVREVLPNEKVDPTGGIAG